MAESIITFDSSIPEIRANEKYINEEHYKNVIIYRRIRLSLILRIKKE